MKIGAVIIVYHPDLRALASNVINIIDDVEMVILYQNSILNHDFLDLNSFKNKVVLLGDGTNEGIGKALNNSIHFLKQMDLTHVVTLDQDSYFKKGHFNFFCNIINNDIKKNIGIYVPNFVNRGVKYISGVTDPFEIADAITSGSVFSLKLFDQVGDFNNYLFIDAVDQEFCYRINANFGLKTIMVPSVELIHELGYSSKIIFGITTLNYSSFRTYYLVRNHILLWKKYPKLYKREYKETLLKEYIFYRIIKIIIGEHDKWNKVKSVFKGIHDGIKCHL
jgi:rhamnosyltransferase